MSDKHKLDDAMRVLVGMIKIVDVDAGVKALMEFADETQAAEREACAKIAEEVARGLVISTDHDRGLSQASTFIAAAIRARGQTTSD